MRQIRRKILAAVFGALGLFAGYGNMVYAATEHILLQMDVEQDKVIAYFEGNQQPKEIDFQIGKTSCEKIEVTGMSENPFPYHTLILVDNSLSVTKQNRERYMEILQVYIQNKKENEQISLAVYGEDITFLTNKSSDIQELLVALERISTQNQDTYLTDVLYGVLDSLDTGELTRFIIISDGVDNKYIGITREELMEKLRENRHPVYTVGHIYKENEQQLESMFGIARATNGKELLLDEVKDTVAAAETLRDMEDVFRITAEIPETLRDGSDRKALFTFGGTDGEVIKVDIAMPFSVMKPEKSEEVTEPEAVLEPKQESAPVQTEEIQPEPESELEKGTGTFGLLLIGILAVGVIVMAYLIFGKKKKPNKQDKKPKEKSLKRDFAVPSQPQTSVEVSSPVEFEEERTILFSSADSKDLPVNGDHLLVLQDTKEKERIFRFPLNNKVILGRNASKVQIAVDYNRTVSGQHCEIYIRNGKCYIRDLGSANKTRVGGRVISDETEVHSGSLIRLGMVEFEMRILPDIPER